MGKMVTVLVYSEKQRDIDEICSAARELIARLSGEQWELIQIVRPEKLCAYLAGGPLVHMFIFDIRTEGSLRYLSDIRKSYPQARLMVLADVRVSPMKYIRPGLQVGALLLRPWTQMQMQEVLADFFGEYLAYVQREKEGDGGSFVIENRDGTLNIPYEQICFFEAREKKIYVCIGKEEYGFYSSIDRLAEELPPYFARCHRGFIVNTRKIRRVATAQNLICLSGGFQVPLSRSYKAAWKGAGNHGTGR